MPPRKACAPTRANWITAAPPPRMAKSPTVQWPASMTLLEKMTLLPTRQSWPTWLLARKAQRSPTTVAMPPPSVPGFMVTPSRIRQSAPIVERRGLALVLQVLRLVADRGEREDARARADRGAAGDHDVADQLDAVAEHDVAADHAERADAHAVAEPRARPRRSPSAWTLRLFWHRPDPRSWR